MKTLVTGGTGLVGNCVVRSLLARGHEVRALVRNLDRARPVLPAACEVVQGDVTRAQGLREAVESCGWVIHAAGLPEQWRWDPGIFERVNVGGTRNMVEAALDVGVERFVYTSTIDVFQAEAGEVFDETILATEPKRTAYERSKQAGDGAVADAIERGLPAVFVHPAAVYGTGPARSPGVRDFVAGLLGGGVPALPPGGLPLVWSEDVGEGHVRAAERASVGDRFILCESYATLRRLAEEVRDILGDVRIPRTLPLGVARAVARAGEAVAKVTKRPPLLARGQLEFLQWQAIPNATRAMEELDLEFLARAEGLQRLVEHVASGR